MSQGSSERSKKVSRARGLLSSAARMAEIRKGSASGKERELKGRTIRNRPVGPDSCARDRPPQDASLLLDGRGRVHTLAHESRWPFSEARVGAPARSLPPQPFGQVLERLWASADREKSDGIAEEVAIQAPDGSIRRLYVQVGLWRHKPDLYSVCVKDVPNMLTRLDELAGEVDRLTWEMKEAEEAMRGLVHDIRSPLSGLRGLLGLLQQAAEGQLSERASNLLEHCRSAAQHLDEVVHSASEARPQSAGPATTRLIHIASTILVELRHANSAVPFTCVVEGREASAAIPGYVLWRVLWNLAGNAIAYRSPERPLHLVLRAWQRLGRCMLELRDNGIGLVPGEEEAIFLRGRRGSNVGVAAGTGLGLHQARTQVETWGGQLWRKPDRSVRRSCSNFRARCRSDADIGRRFAGDCFPTRRSREGPDAFEEPVRPWGQCLIRYIMLSCGSGHEARP